MSTSPKWMQAVSRLLHQTPFPARVAGVAGASSAAMTLYHPARFSSTKTSEDQVSDQGSQSTQAASSSGPPAQAPSSPWVEVVHEATGQVYYWNQRTGQTTALGEPAPAGWKSDGSSGGGQTGGGHSSGAGSGEGSGDSSEGSSTYVDPRAETPLPDKTGEYAAIGAVTGIALGWASQFF